jgi:hypothetical protein
MTSELDSSQWPPWGSNPRPKDHEARPEPFSPLSQHLACNTSRPWTASDRVQSAARRNEAHALASARAADCMLTMLRDVSCTQADRLDSADAACGALAESRLAQPDGHSDDVCRRWRREGAGRARGH